MDKLTELYCHIDDFCKAYTAEQQRKMLALKSKSSKRTRNKPCCISLAEIITLLVLFHQIRYREFKAFYFGYVCQWLKKEFPKLPSYQRMTELMAKVILNRPRFTSPLIEQGIAISMDGRGRALDNIFVERLWRSVKYECVYLQEFG